MLSIAEQRYLIYTYQFLSSILRWFPSKLCVDHFSLSSDEGLRYQSLVSTRPLDGNGSWQTLVAGLRQIAYNESRGWKRKSLDPSSRGEPNYWVTRT